jgi:hypothetical protein
VSERFHTTLTAWAGFICAIATLIGLILTWALATAEQRSEAIKYIFGWSQGADTPHLRAPPDFPQEIATIAGVWSGKIYYLDGRAPKPFTFTFDAVGCRGRGGEPNTFGDSTSTRLYSNLECATNTLSPGQIFTIKKTYDGTAGATHTVIYRGTVSSDERQVSGEWTTPHGNHGNFILQR